MRFIPRGLLIHSAEVFTPVSEDGFGNVLYSCGEVLKFIRVDLCGAVGFEGMRKSDKSSAVLIYDCRNSYPQRFEFICGQKVVFGGAKYTVSSVEKFYEKKLLHHIEVGLI